MKQITLYGPGHGPSFFFDDDTANELLEHFTKGHDLHIHTVNKSKRILIKSGMCWAMEQNNSTADDERLYRSQIAAITTATL